MNQTPSFTWTGRAALAVIGAGAAAAIGFAAPAAADSGSGTGSGCNTVDSTTSAGGAQTSNGGQCTPNTNGANGIGPGGPAYNGTDPRS